MSKSIRTGDPKDEPRIKQRFLEDKTIEVTVPDYGRRNSAGREETVRLTINLPINLEEALQTYCAAQGKSIDGVVTRALKIFLP